MTTAEGATTSDPGSGQDRVLPPVVPVVRTRTPPSRWTRRELLASAARGGLPLGAVAAGAASVAACRPAPTSPMAHLVRRLTYGCSGPALDHVFALGTPAWLDEQLDPASLDTSALDSELANFPALRMSAAQLAATYPNGDAAALQLGVATFVRQVLSPAQLFERMVEFWSDHLNVPVTNPTSAWLKIVEDREVIRPNALGTFADLLVASAQSPAMLVYLDNASSVASAPNENYGRELLELHTVGVDGGYTEADVKATARLLTGWTVDRVTGLFRFMPQRHDPGPVTIMGWNRPTTGTPLDHGVAFLRWLARRPATATRIARKLAVRFVGDGPDEALVAELAAAYTANDTAIVPVLRTLVAHPAFLDSPRARFRRPLHQLASVLRGLSADLVVTGGTESQRVFAGVARMLGQVPFGWPAPNGYPDAQGAWLTTGGLLARWNAAAMVCAEPVHVLVDWPAHAAGLGGKAPEAVVDGLASRVLFEAVTPQQRGAVISSLWPAGAPAALTQAEVAQVAPVMAALLHCIPEVQFC